MEMTSGRIAPAFVKFSIPLLLGNLFQFFYSTTDILIVGNYCDTASLAAIGASANIIFTLTGFFNGLANGAGVLVAHLYGAKDGNKIRKTMPSTKLNTIPIPRRKTFIKTSPSSS